MSCISMLALERPSRAYKRTPACIAPRNLNERAFPRRPGNGVRAVGYVIFNMSKRLSATDISALASMKNVAKCDTWCELQNPVNHRVFERKLRPRPSGRGHACLGVTPRCPAPTRPLVKGRGVGTGRMMASRVPRHAAGINTGSPAASASTIGGCLDLGFLSCAGVVVGASRCASVPVLPTRPQVRRGYPLNLSISISGGKETYEDSLSNGERTGNSPA